MFPMQPEGQEPKRGDPLDIVLGEMNKNPMWAMGDASVSGPPTFARAVSGIENGDYQGLEMLTFGAVNGVPAVSFVDEDNQRQVIRVTMPQWQAMIGQRDSARAELRQRRELEAKKQAFAPQFKALATRVGESQDPIISEYLGVLYEMDPGAAMQGLQSFLKARSGRENYTMYRGMEVPESMADAIAVIEDDRASKRDEMFGRAAAGFAESGRRNMATSINMISTLTRPRGDRVMPRSMTLPQYAMQSQNPMALAHVVDAMRQGVFPGLGQTVQLPTIVNSRIDPQSMEQFMQRFNEVSGAMGWGPAGEQDIPVILDAIARVSGGSYIPQEVEVPSSSKSSSATSATPAAPSVGMGQRNSLDNISRTAADPVLRRMLQSGNTMEMQSAFVRLKYLYEQSRRDPSILPAAGISKADIEAVYSLLTQE